MELAAQMGAAGVDFDLCERFDYRKEGNLYSKSDEEIAAYFCDLRAYAESLGIKIVQTHGRIEGFRNIKEEDDALVKNARLDMLATKSLGAKYCVFHTVTTIFMGKDADPKLMHFLHDDFYLRIMPYAKQYGVVICTETFGDAPGTGVCDFFGQMDEFVNAYNRIASIDDNEKYFKVCMDVGHTNKALRFAGNPTPQDAVLRLGKAIVVTHLHDNDGITDQHKIPMTGTISWSAVLDALDQIGFDGYYNLELNLRHFGADFSVQTARFGVEVMQYMLQKHFEK
jgi:sugar phosphate isomerase/epimerase